MIWFFLKKYICEKYVNLSLKLNILSVFIFCIKFISVSSVAQEPPIKLTYLGTAGWIIDDGTITVLVDPYISRIKLGNGPSISPDDNRPIVMRNDFFESDTASIDSIITKADFILVHHSHFDHLSDVPYIAYKTGAKVIGTETTVNILRAYGIPNTQLYPVKGGEDYQFDNFSVRIVPSLHSALNQKHYIDSRVYNEPPEAPLRISEFIEGGSLSFLARFKNHTILTMGSMNFIERELFDLNPDILLAGINQSQLGLYNYNERLIKGTDYPKFIIPTHWDNFRLPYGYSQQAAIDLKLIPFIKDIGQLSPESEVIIPVHLETISID